MREIEKTIVLNGRKVRVSVPARTISKEEFERITTPIFKKIAKRLEEK